MSSKTPSIAMEDQEKILILAESLIREPETWVEGEWKCPLWETEPGTSAPRLENGRPVQAKDKNGRPLYQYCIEGAVNQATLDVLGQERAVELNAVDVQGDEVVHNVGEFNHERESAYERVNPTELLGLNQVALDLAEDEGWLDRVNGSDRAAMSLNDEWGQGHQAVLKVLRTRLKQVQEQLKSK